MLSFDIPFCNVMTFPIGLYELWKTGRYKSYPPNTLVDLIARILALVPPWTRVYRVQRYSYLDFWCLLSFILTLNCRLIQSQYNHAYIECGLIEVMF